jgi:hypothetical protein
MITFRFFSIVISAAFICMVLFLNPAGAADPESDANEVFSQQEEAQIQALAALSTQEVLEELKKPDFMVKRDLTARALQVALGNRKAEAIHITQNWLKEPMMEVIDGQLITRARDFALARMVFDAFPDEAVPSLLWLYQKSDGITRGNIIRTAGGLDGGMPMETMLIKALDDKSAAEEESPEQLGDPLRVCDLAYNQVVLRFSVMNVLRTISPTHSIETRDYHIGILKSHLAAGH